MNTPDTIEGWRSRALKAEAELKEAKEALRITAINQREACAEFMENERWCTSLAARRAPLVTDEG